ncbi:AAA domain-containing protein [Puia dinghuensis]|uniref:DNA helicase n=1 Tax=Puia dinghuensis TaxID=1792502 RepID=A0A8J2XUE9_9BACT|nr:AAA domain-containing protein [Puia dinghuensis]GGB11180.1 DNA helicase [Puia dinghuensis]
MESNRISFASFLSTAFDKGDYSTDDTIAFVLPLFREVLSFHEAGLVAPFEKEEALFVNSDLLDIDENLAHAPTSALHRVEALFPRVQSRHFEVVGKWHIKADTGEGTTETGNLAIHTDAHEPLRHAAYLPGYRCFEHLVGHHDPQTDIFCLGLILASMAMGLDLYDAEDLHQLLRVRTNPSQQYPRIHPTLGRLITEMTELDRSRRSQDLYDVITRLEHYRDYDPEKQTDLSQVAGWVHKELKERDAFILNRLRNRLFDLTRRNRLLYYKPNMRFVNLTVSSVPMVLHYQSIRPELLFTWNPGVAEQIIGMKEIVLNKYLRFEDHGYLPSSLDAVRVESQRNIQEYGFSQLRLVIAFLNWHNLKENPKERIQSPLLLVPVSLKKNKKVKEDHYVLKVLDNAAEVNPVLAGQLKDLYGIRLPDLVDLDEMSMEQFYRLLQAQIEEANQGIVLRYIDKPRIRLIHSEARQTVSNYRRKLRRMPGQEPGYRSIPYTYDPEHYKPMGLEIFRQRIEPRHSFLEFLVNTDLETPHRDHLTDPYDRPSDPQPRPSNPVRERDIYQITESESNPYSWDFDVCNMVLGNFNYKKMSLVQDYNVVIDRQLQHDTFDALFSREPRVFPEHPFDGNRPDDWYHVVTADPTQTKAILQSRAGYSYIIQGPPGTGKSQTITNLIADFVARGKSILFVCEKRAALDVVYHRLKQVGLEELCCYIHDSQGDKREFIRNLRSTYENFIEQKLDLTALKTRRESLLHSMNHHLDLVREFHERCLEEGKETGLTGRELIEQIIALRQHLVNLSARQEEALPSYKEWKDAGAVIAELEAVLEETGADAVFALHPFSRVQESIFLDDSPHKTLDEALQQALQALDEAETLLKACRLEPRQVQEAERLKNLVQFAVLLYPLARTGNMALADPDRPEAKELKEQFDLYQQQQEAYRLSQQENLHWKHKLPADSVGPALDLANKQEGAFFSMFNGSWRKLKHQLQDSYDFSAHNTGKPSRRHLLELLKNEYGSAAQLEQTRQQLQQRFKLDQNIDTARLSIDLLHGKKGHPELDYLLQHPDGAALVISLQALHQPLNRLETRLKRCLQDLPTGSLAETKDELLNIQLNADGLRDWLPALRSFTRLPGKIKATLRSLPLSMKQAEAAIAKKALHQLYQSHRGFANIDAQALEKAVLQLGEGYIALQQLNAQLIRAFVRQRFLQQLELAGRAASQLNEDQKKFKKTFTEGRKILENEFAKSMRYKSIRELSEKESGVVLKTIKPVWLMSPYSVSDSLPLDADLFDVVIFDEASQITLEEGVPAVYRSRQVIIVGDEKQMPPTDFFTSGLKHSDPDDLDKTNGEDEDWLADDADSLLAQGARKLESTLLSWHYRSHFETLISFSNHAFYEGELLTIPDKTIHHQEKAPIRVSGPADAAAQVNSLFDRSISFHLLTGSVYEKRTNPAEADYIAALVRELLLRGTPESIGIVAFSQEQQHAIESALDSLAGEDAHFAQLLEEAYNRTENDQYAGLIIKNLENIQGDERDIIIMSVCYGPDSRHRMLMNFGPINKKGGEKRLNVLFSRARRHMAVVSSIRYEQITNEYNEGANYLRRFLQYAEVISGGHMGVVRTILDGLVPHKTTGNVKTTPTIIREQLKEQLTALGYTVAGPIGQSDFKCSLAVKRRPEDSAYALAILIDDEGHYRNENLIEQYYQRPAILRNFGWKVIPVYAKDWLHQPQKVMEQIVKALKDEPGHPATAPASDGTIPHLPMSPESASAGPYDHLAFRRLVNQAGNAGSFWEAATDGNKLIIRWGRTGTRGQTRLKTFAEEESARKELDRQEKEQIEKGYRPSS